MKVILNADVPHLGEEGEIKEVKSGYARNFLIPRKLCLPYNNESIAVIESRRDAIEKRREDKRQAAMGLKAQLENKPLAISMTTGRNGKLFGSVNAATIATELEKNGIHVERKSIDIPENSLKSVGNYKVSVKLYGGETATLTVAVSSSSVVAEDEKPVETVNEAPLEEETVVEAEAEEAAAEEQTESAQDSQDDE
ncbi:50S ribosomal protein L9 [Spirochaeta dissipatitropha]